LVGFFPSFCNLAETGRAVMIAKQFRDLGGEAIFFSHGGKYEFLAEKNGFNVIKVNPSFNEEQMQAYFQVIALESFELPQLTDEQWLYENVINERDAFKKTGVQLVLSTNNLTCALSARAAHIPFINVIPGAGCFALTFPENLENMITRMLPQFIKVKLANLIIQNTRKYLSSINKIAKKVGVRSFTRTLEIKEGDVTFATSDLDFINVFPHQQFYPKDNYQGMILLDNLFINAMEQREINTIEHEIEKHLKKPGRSILVSLGSSGIKNIFLKILQTLNETSYNVVAIHSSILDEKNLPPLNDNILLKQFVPSIGNVNRMVDLAVIHGGQGTVYTCIYAQKPLIGIPMHIEQHLNLEKCIGHGIGIMLSRKFFTPEKLLNAIDEIFTNYDTYLSSVQRLSQKIPPPEGDKKIAKRLLELLTLPKE
jgi:UDP-N-acetylglucosamine:LPS N-acetylglucosamine transferase